MKKFLLGFVVVIALLGAGGYACYKSSYGGTEYFVKVTTDGKKATLTADNGDKIPNYEYSLEGYDKDGNEKKIDFTGDHNLRKGAYLELTYNDKKGVTNWEEVKESEVPEDAVKHLK